MKMNRKIINIAMVGLLSMSLVGCKSNTPKEADIPSVDEAVTEVKEETKLDFDGSKYSDMGKGEFGLSCPSGYTLEGDKAIIYLSKDEKTILMQIGIESREMDGALLSYVYIDGLLNQKIQLSDTQATINLKDSSLKPGEHLVEAVQYIDNDPANEVVTYKSATYTIEEK